MARILVTGGAGFIGSHIVEDISAKHDVVVLDNLATANTASHEFVRSLDIEFVNGDVNDQTLLRRVMQGIEYVLHQAAIPSVPRSIKDPLATNHANVGGTLSVLKAASDAGVKKVVAASSSSIYGDTPTIPKVETMEPNPKSPYAISKLAGEHYCRVFKELYGLKTVSLRYFNVFGPRQDPASQYSAVIPKFVHAALHNQPLVVFGDGTQTRDFTFVKDVVSANLKALKSSATGAFNIAGGKRISIGELAREILRLTGSKSKIIYGPEREGDVKHSLADISKARRELEWAPEYAFEDGLSEVVSYLRGR